jgi:hypothetical protein
MSDIYDNGAKINKNDVDKLLSKVNVKLTVDNVNDLDKIQFNDEFKQFFSPQTQSCFRREVNSLIKSNYNIETNDGDVDLHNAAGLMLFNGSFHGIINFNNQLNKSNYYVGLNILPKL